MTSPQDGLITARLLDEKGGASLLDWAGVVAQWDTPTVVWVHLDSTNERAKDWLYQSSGLDEATVDVLVSEETRPHCHVVGDGILVNLRGVNPSPQADPEDMISLRMWVEPNRIITLRRNKLSAVEDVARALDDGEGPTNAASTLLVLADHLVRDVGDFVNDLEDQIDEAEEQVLASQHQALRGRISGIRRKAITVRRHLAPQREAFVSLQAVQLDWLGHEHKSHYREIAGRVTRYVEDLDLIRDRALVVQEDLVSRLAEHTNRTLYVLSLITAIFLPLGLIAGILGINVGGMPGIESEWAFWVVCGVMVAVSVIEVVALRLMRWL
ncbi:MAG: zinc transporter ZntB [Planctomycetota bacterium]